MPVWGLEVFGSGVVAQSQGGEGGEPEAYGGGGGQVGGVRLGDGVGVAGGGVGSGDGGGDHSGGVDGVELGQQPGEGRGGLGGGVRGVDEGAVQCAGGPAVGTRIAQGGEQQDVEQPARGFTDQRGSVVGVDAHDLVCAD